MKPHEQAQFLSALGKFVKSEITAAIESYSPRLAQLELALAKVREQQECLATPGDIASVIKEASEAITNSLRGELIPKMEDMVRQSIPDIKDGADGKDGRDGKDGKDGRDGKDVSLVTVANLIDGAVDQYFSKHPVSNGVDGKEGPPGKDGKDGNDGLPGADGKSVSLDEMRSHINDCVNRAVDQLPVPRSVASGHISRDGHFHIVFSDGTSLDLGEIVGKDGAPGKDGVDGVPGKDGVDGAPGKDGADGKDGANGKDGADGIGIENLVSVEFDGSRGFVFRYKVADRVEERSVKVPFVIYKGVWKQGSYSHGDSVTRDGNVWIAMRDTEAQPGTVDSGWQLATKRGRDGKDGERGPPGQEGKPGRDGKDLTQLGQDGLKWG